MWTILEKELQLHPISSWKLIHGAECWGDDVRNEALRGGWRYKAWLEMPPGRVRRGRFYSQLCLRGDVKPTCWGGVRASCREAPDAGGWQGRRHQLWRRGYRAAPFQGMNLSVQGICTGIAQLTGSSCGSPGLWKVYFSAERGDYLSPPPSYSFPSMAFNLIASKSNNN